MATFFLQQNWNIVREYFILISHSGEISPEKKENAATHYKGFLWKKFASYIQEILFFLFGIFLAVFPLSFYTLIRRCKSGAEKDDDEVFALLQSGAHEDERTQKALKWKLRNFRAQWRPKGALNLLLTSSPLLLLRSFLSLHLHSALSPSLSFSVHGFSSFIAVGFFSMSRTSCNAPPGFLCSSTFCFYLERCSVFLLRVCCHTFPLAFFCVATHHFLYLIFFPISLICLFACRSCFPPPLFCGRSHDLILLHLCWRWASSSTFSYGEFPCLHCTLVKHFKKHNWNFKVFV